MCGIVGYIGFERAEALLRRMAQTIRHRGPDDDGEFLHNNVGLAIRRLSIIDVDHGHQPIFNEDHSVALVFNGEIYNYRELSKYLVERGHSFATHCDAETIVHLYEEHGIDCIHRLRGMFAFALYDLKQEKLFLVRDRLGIKPLYYCQSNGRLLFGSEIKAILECDELSRQPNLPAVDAYLTLRYVPGPETLFSGVRKLPAGHWLSYSAGKTELVEYWTPSFSAGPYQADEYYEERFAELFTDAVRTHMVSDVPLGAFLSGGVDSTAIVATMSRIIGRPLKTFSVGFNSPGDELPAAREVANRLGCEHHEVICRPEDIALLPKIVWHLDEPIGDAIVLPMYLLSRLAGEKVKVALSGEGGDEILAGYFFHKVMHWADKYVRWTPEFMRRQIFEPTIAQIPSRVLTRAFAYPAELGERGRVKVLDYLKLLGNHEPEAEYRFLISLFDRRDQAKLYNGELRSLLDHNSSSAKRSPRRNDLSYLNFILRLQYADWLPDDILMKTDKMSMANSVEGRVPFLDHLLVEFLFQTPPHLKLSKLVDKVLLRKYLGKVLPGKAARQPKRPFYIPMEQYFSTPIFQEFIETCLSEQSVRRRGYFSWEGVRQILLSARSGDFLFVKQVLSLVMLELWHRIYIDRETGWVN
jgi:asparagine synthase (glutamine-hydrolysing)